VDREPAGCRSTDSFDFARKTKQKNGAMRVPAFSLLGVVSLVGLLMAAFGASCGDADRAETPRPVVRPAPSVRLLLITDLKGYLEPCGCTSRPLGGIDRMAAKVAALRSDGAPTLVVVAGDTLFSGDRHGVDRADAATQEIWKAEALASILEGLGVAAVTPGPLDLAHGADGFLRIAGTTDFPWLAAGVEMSPVAADEGTDAANAPTTDTTPGGDESPLAPHRIIRFGELAVGLVGLTDLGGNDRVETPPSLASAAEEEVRALQEAGADIVVALVRSDRRTGRQLAANVDGIDFVVQGGLDLEQAIAPATVGDTAIVHAGRQGQGLVVVDIYHRGSGAYGDWSDWTLAEERARLDRRVTDLRARIEEWEQADDVDDDDVARQRQRLASLERERDALRVPERMDGNAFNAEYVELPPEAARDPRVTRQMEAYDRRVNSHNRVAFADLAPLPAPPGQAHYVGSAACESCHAPAVQWWRRHPHGRAYQTLVDRHKEFNLSCVGCHVTGYMEPGGSTVTHNLDGALVDVGCESCHGPGSRHIETPDAPSLVARDTAEGVCVTCHNPEHSDTFVYQGYRAALIVPGHGLPVAAP
jgi:hypothetical protein